MSLTMGQNDANLMLRPQLCSHVDLDHVSPFRTLLFSHPLILTNRCFIDYSQNMYF